MSRRPGNGPVFQANHSVGSTIHQIGQVNIGATDGGEAEEKEVAVVLFLASDPYTRTRLRLDLEMKAVGEALRSAGNEASLGLEHFLAPTFQDIQHALLRHRPAVLHFSGHGTPSGEIELERDPQVPDGSRRPDPKDQRPAEALGRLIGAVEDLEVRCAVLNACFSETQAAEVTKAVDCVVAVVGEVRDSAAIEFARGFYGALAWGQSVNAAFEQGLAQVKTADDAGQYRLLSGATDPRSVRLLARI